MMAGTAHAVPITGDIGIIGSGYTAIDPLTATAIPAPSYAIVTNPTGDFDTLLDTGDLAIYNGNGKQSPNDLTLNNTIFKFMLK